MFSLIVNSHGVFDAKRLLLYWGCDDAVGDKLRDYSGNGWNAVVKAGKTSWVAGKVGKGIRMQQAYAQVDGNIMGSIENIGEITLMLWFYMNQHVDLDGLITIKSQDGECCPYQLMINSSYNPSWSSGNSVIRSLPSFALDQKRWYHYALTVNQASSSIYVDGKLLGTQAENSKIPGFKSATVYLGTGESPGIDAVEDTTFDEVMIWNKSLVQEEIAQAAWNSFGVTVIDSRDKLAKTWGWLKPRD